MITIKQITSNFAKFESSVAEWIEIKRMLNLAANPYIYVNSRLERVSGRTLALSEIEALSKKFEKHELPPNAIGKSDIQTLLAVCQNITDASVDTGSLDPELFPNIERQMQNYNKNNIFVR